MTRITHTRTVLACFTLVVVLGAASPSSASRVRLDVDLAQPVLQTGATRTAYLKVGLTGFEKGHERTPVNVALVLDRSGSMQGEKLARARQAAIAAIDRLGPDDIVSVVAYSDNVRVLVPATRLTDRDSVRSLIQGLEAGGYTALFAGVSRGAAEVRKFADPRYVNRVLLLSDGLANIGPDTPAELGALGASLKKEGFSVTTIGLGLGYNEDLMSRLASRSDGNHAFVEHPRDLARIFDYEFSDVLSVIAQEVVVTIVCPPGVRPVRVLGREAEVVGSTVTVTLNQLYAEQEKYVLVELEVPEGREGETRQLAEVEVTYANMATGSADRLADRATTTFAATDDVVRRHTNSDVMVAVVEQIATEQNMLAVVLRDQGRTSEAESLLMSNASFIDSNADQFDSDRLRSLAESNRADAQNLSDKDWAQTRKQMRATQEKTKKQRVW